MKKILLPLLIITVLLTGCSQIFPTSQPEPQAVEPASEPAPQDIEEEPLLNVDEDGYTSFNRNRLKTEIATFEENELSEAEKEGLIFMREEEKLAHDIYAYFYEKWETKAFTNISSSEQTHTDAVKTLLDRYSIDDPSSDTKSGEYGNAKLQDLYDQLVAQGDESEIEALKVGAIVEEVDIIDLEEFLKDVDNEDITLVYENLLKGSRNHLRAYVRNLDNRGVEYTPAYLSQEQYQEIIDEEVERGNGGGGRH